MPFPGKFPAVFDGPSGPPVFDPSFQFRIKNKLQQCESIRITITEIDPVPLDVAASLEAVDLEVGVKIGGFKGLGKPNTIG